MKGYSLGMRQRLGLAAALLGDPELLVLDEPANGLDPEGVRWLRDFLRAFASEGHTVLVSSHVLAEVAQTVDRVADHQSRPPRRRVLARRAHGPRRRRGARAQPADCRELPGPWRRAGRRRPQTLTSTPSLPLGTTPERVGDIAFAAGVALHELTTEGSSLEEVFLELTSEVRS